MRWLPKNISLSHSYKRQKVNMSQNRFLTCFGFRTSNGTPPPLLECEHMSTCHTYIRCRLKWNHIRFSCCLTKRCWRRIVVHLRRWKISPTRTLKVVIPSIIDSNLRHCMDHILCKMYMNTSESCVHLINSLYFFEGCVV